MAHLQTRIGYCSPIGQDYKILSIRTTIYPQEHQTLMAHQKDHILTITIHNYNLVNTLPPSTTQTRKCYDNNQPYPTCQILTNYQ